MSRPTAAQRTISLFTGKTDLEDPTRARDGTYGEPPPDRGGSKRDRWVAAAGSVARWVRTGQMILCVRTASGLRYELTSGGKHRGLFDTIVQAADAADEVRRG